MAYTRLHERWARHDAGRSRDPDQTRERSRPVVLVVEDSEDDWEIYGKVLWYNGFDVVLGKSAEEGFTLALEYEPDLVLLDMILPDGTGLELCRRLRENPRTVALPVLVLSAHPESKWGGRLDAMGCLSYLEKPISPLTVLHAVEEVVGRPPPAGDNAPAGALPIRQRDDRRPLSAEGREYRPARDHDGGAHDGRSTEYG